MIYFAQADVSGQIKIGYHGGTDANDRLRELQTGCPTKLFLLGTLPGGPETEADLHKRFAFAHAHGEWFKPVPELLAFIGQQSSGPKLNGTAVESRFVQIKVLTVGQKSFTEALYKQLPQCDIINWDACSPHAPLVEWGEPWGWIRRPYLHPSANPPTSRKGNHWCLALVWQCSSDLFRHYIPLYFQYSWTREYRERAADFYYHEESKKLEDQYRPAWEATKKRWLNLGQLFIGV
jgi:hypothetical protein